MGVKVNFSDQEAQSKDFEPLPEGKYHMKIFDVTWQECGPNSKNPGKPFYAFDFVVQKALFPVDPPNKYERQHAWTNAMLFQGALYTISNILKGLGYTEEELKESDFEIPDPEFFIGKDLIVRMAMGKAQVGEGTKENPQYPARVEPRGFTAYKGDQAAASSKATSLLPS